MQMSMTASSIPGSTAKMRPARRGALDAGEIEQLWGYIRASAYDAAGK
jgi:hypothetical protein